MLALGIVAAIGASVLYNASIALQALEARRVPGEHSLRPSLVGRLLRSRRWLWATALGLLGWPLEIAALLLAPLTVVQPCIAAGLILLLWLGASKLGESPGRREAIAVAAIVAGVSGVAWASPVRTVAHSGAGAIALAMALLAIPVAAPYLVRRRDSGAGLLAVLSAGSAYAATAIATKLLSDGLAGAAPFAVVAGLATAAVSSGVGLLSEMSALQRRAATHVAPVMFATQVILPVLLAPLIFGESWAGTPLGGLGLAVSIAVAVTGTALLAGSPAVGAVLESSRERA